MTYDSHAHAPPRARRTNGQANGRHKSDELEQLTAEQAAEQLDPKAHRSGKGWSLRCPAHDDKSPSLSISDKPDGGLLVTCHAHCAQDDVIAAIEAKGIAVRVPAKSRSNKPDMTGNIRSLLKRGCTLVKAYSYTDEDGVLLFENVRLGIHVDGKPFKTFRQRRPTELEGYVENLDGVRRVPYRLAQVLQAVGQDVHVPEGEKDADRLAALGVCSSHIPNATTTELEAFRDRDVVLHADNDQPGRDKAAAKAKALATIARSVRVVHYIDAIEGGDVSDWLDAGHTFEELLQRCEEAPSFTDSPATTNTERPVIRIKPGKLAETASEAERHLIAAFVPFYQRGSTLVRPIVEEVLASDGGKTTTAALRPVSPTYLRDQLSRVIAWEVFRRRDREWSPADPPREIAETIIERNGEWGFRSLNGVITTPTLRPDGTILSAGGYDEATRLLLVDPPTYWSIPASPTRDDAQEALKTLGALLGEFPFVDPASRSVALSALITPVGRGAYPVAPMHTARAPTAGTGKSFLFDLASAIATGQRCHVIAAGRDEAETEKRLAACVLAGYPMVSLDNVNGELGGDFLCQLIERPVVSPRVLGKSEQPRLPNRMTIFATGNNLRLVGDMTRRAVICSLDARVERPELRSFKTDPVERVLADRGRYVAAALTILRAYVVAGRPDLQPRLASFGEWSDTVRSALMWLDCADPVATIAEARAEDPKLQTLTAVLDAWREAIGVGASHYRTAAALLATSHLGLAEAIAMIGLSTRAPAKSLGKWLADNRGCIVGHHRLVSAQVGDQALRWHVEAVSV